MESKDKFGDHTQDPAISASGHSGSPSTEKKHEEELMRQFAQKDVELSNLIEGFTSDPRQSQFVGHKVETIVTSTHSTYESGVGDLLGDFGGGGTESITKITTKSTTEPLAAGGDMMMGSIMEMTQDKEYFGKNSSAFRLDKMSPPRSPFMELDKSGIGAEELGLTSEEKEEIIEPRIAVCPSAPIVDMVHHGTEEFVNNKGFEMISSLDNIQPPEFYESPSASKSKNDENKPKSASDSPILEPDDIDEYLPKDPTDSFSTASTVSATSAKLTKDVEPPKPSALITESFTEYTTTTTITSPEKIKTKAADFEMFQEKSEPHAATSGKESYDFYTKEPVLNSEDNIPMETEYPETSFKTHDLLFNEPPTVDKSPSPLPGFQLEDDHLREFEAKHAELSNFLQEHDPSSGLVLDEFDRSDDSISPNPLTSIKSQEKHGVNKMEEDYGFDFGKESPQFNEPAIQAVKVGGVEAGVFSSNKSTPFEHLQFEKESPESVDDFEVIPPKVPPHRYPIQETSTTGIGSFEDFYNPPVTSGLPQKDLYKVGDPIGLSPTPPPSAVELEKKASEAAAAAKKAEDEFVAFLPKGSFETIPTVYTEPTTTTSPKVEVVKKVEEKPKDQVKAPVLPKKVVTPKKNDGSNEIVISEEAQKILNIFNPRAWFSPNKLHPKVSELVYWRDPKKSGVVFGGIFVILIALTFLSFISVVAYTSLAILSGTFAFRVYKNILQTIQKTQDGHPFKEYLEQDLVLENDKTQEICNAVVAHLNKFAVQLRHLFLVEDLVDSAKFGAALYFLTYLGSWFNGLTLLILAFVALFALPKVYEMNKNVIDQYIDLAWAKISEIMSKVGEVLPFGKKEKAQ